MRATLRSVALCGGLLLYAAAVLAAPQLPVAPVRPVTDDYFGTPITDPYRWMEDRHAPEFLAWAKAENDYTRAVLAAIPGREALLQRILALDSGGTRIRGVQTEAGAIVYQKRGPADEVFKLYLRRGVAGPEKLLLDPNAEVSAGKHGAIDYYQLSPDARYIAVGVSLGGSEESVIRVLETATGKILPERIDRTEYGNPSWRADSRSFFYNRFAEVAPGAAETAKYLGSRAYLHRLGQPVERDAVTLGVGVDSAVSMTPVDFPLIVTTPGSRWAVAVINHGSSPEVTLYIAPAASVGRAGTVWRPLADVADGIATFAVHGDDVYLLSHKNASRSRILKVAAGDAVLAHATVAVPESGVVIQEFSVAEDALYFRVQDAGVQRLRRLVFATQQVADLDPSLAGGIPEFATSASVPGVFFALQSWIIPPRWLQVGPGSAAARDVGWMAPWSVDTSAYEVEEVTATAADGTAIPLSIVHRRGMVRDGSHRVWLTGYGAYGIPLIPSFVPAYLALLERDGVVAVAHVRGGGELGEDWHNAGKQATKPNTHRDLIACALYLVEQKITAPGRLAIQGGSAGGITVGMALTERPDLFRVVLSDVGDSNALRAEFETDGDANALEYGSTKTPAGFKALLAVDALSHVKDGTAYPATLLTTGINDPRVAPWQPGKMAARLQAATSSQRPVLLRVDYDAGHGIGSTRRQRDELYADQLAFMFWQTEDLEFQPKAP